MAHQPLHRKLLTGGVLCLFALSAAACGGDSGDSGDEGDSGGTYKWGINAEISGPLAFYGETIRDGVKAYVDQVNADGGIDGHQIELKIVDNAGDASRAATNTTQLAQSDQVSAIFGNTLSANCSAATPNAERYKVPMACLSVAETNDWVFNMGPNNVRAAGPALEAAKQLTGSDSPKLASLYNNTLTSIAMGEQISSMAGDAGVDLVADEEVDIAATDFSASVSKIVSADPDAVVVSGTGSIFTSVLKGLRAANLDVPVMWIDGTANLPTIEKVNDPALYAFATYQLVNPDDTSGVGTEYVDAMTPLLDTVNSTMLANGNTAVAYLTAKAWGEALAECGYPCSGEDLQATLSDLEVDLSPMEPAFAYSSDDHYPYPNWYLYQVGQGDKYDLVGEYPADGPLS